MTWPMQLARLICCYVLLIGGVGNAATCDPSTAGAAFGAYDPFSSVSRDTIGTITVTCIGSIGEAVSYTIAADLIVHGGSRVMASGNSYLSYTLYIDSGRTQVWGDGSSGSFVVSDNYQMAASQSSRTYSIYGRVSASQTNTSSGTYSALITLQLTF